MVSQAADAIIEHQGAAEQTEVQDETILGVLSLYLLPAHARNGTAGTAGCTPLSAVCCLLFPLLCLLCLYIRRIVGTGTCAALQQYLRLRDNDVKRMMMGDSGHLGTIATVLAECVLNVCVPFNQGGVLSSWSCLVIIDVAHVAVCSLRCRCLVPKRPRVRRATNNSVLRGWSGRQGPCNRHQGPILHCLKTRSTMVQSNVPVLGCCETL